MSFAAEQLVWKLSLPVSKKIVLLCLAHHHNKDTDRCDPAHDTIAEETGISRRQVIRILDELEASDKVIKIERNRGRNKSNNYSFVNLKCDIAMSHLTQENVTFREENVTKNVTFEAENVTFEPLKCDIAMSHELKELQLIEPLNLKENSAKPISKPAVIPAVKIHVDITGKYLLNKTQINELVEVVGDNPIALEKWKEVVKSWVLKDYSPRNIAGMLEWFRDGIPTHKPRNGVQTNGQSQRNVSRDRIPSVDPFASPA